MAENSTGRVQAMALDITLSLSEPDQERLDKLAAVRKDEDVWEHERKYEQSRRAYLGEDVLKDTGSAVVWWLHRNEDSIDTTVKDIGLLAQLTSAANDEDISERLQHLIPHAVPEAGPYETGEDRIPNSQDRMGQTLEKRESGTRSRSSSRRPECHRTIRKSPCWLPRSRR